MARSHEQALLRRVSFSGRRQIFGEPPRITVLFQTMNDIIGNAVAFFHWFFLFGPKKRRVPNNPALYDCRRCIGNWLAARPNAPTAVTREAKNTAVAAQKTLADYEQWSQQNPEKTNMTGSAAKAPPSGRGWIHEIKY